MRTLDVYIKQGWARMAGIAILTSCAGLVCLFAWLAMALLSEPGNGVLVVCLMPLWAFLIWMTWTAGIRTWRLSQVTGPALQFGPTGVTVNTCQPPRHYRWEDLRYVEWVTIKYTHVLVLRPQKETLTTRLQGFTSSGVTNFSESNLSMPVSEIIGWLLDHAPPGKVKY